MGREIVGGGAGRRGHQHAVADQLGEAHLAVDQDAQPRRLIGLAEQRHLVEARDSMALAAGVRAHISSGWISVFAPRRCVRSGHPRGIRSSGSRPCRGAWRRRDRQRVRVHLRRAGREGHHDRQGRSPAEVHGRRAGGQVRRGLHGAPGGRYLGSETIADVRFEACRGW